MHAQVQSLLGELRWVFDLATLASLFKVTNNSKTLKTDRLEQVLRPYLGDAIAENEIDWIRVVTEPLETDDVMVRETRNALTRVATNGQLVNGRPLRALHWSMAFPDVFANEDSGFDLIVANPPFIGDRNLRKSMGPEVTDWLKTTYTEGKTPDACGFFFLRYHRLLSTQGVAASLGPNTVIQASNRRYVMRPLVSGSDPHFVVTRGLRSRAWPGDAAVHYCAITFARPPLAKHQTLVEADGMDVHAQRWVPRRLSDTTLSSYIDEMADTEPAVLASARHESLLLKGVNIRGANNADFDFVQPLSFKATVPAQERNAIKAKFTASSTQGHALPTPSQLVVDFYDPLDAANLLDSSPQDQETWLLEHYPSIMETIHGMKEVRSKLVGDGYRRHREYWWRFDADAKELRHRMRDAQGAMVFGETVKVWCPSFVPNLDPTTELPSLFTHGLFACPVPSFGVVGLLSSFAFEAFARRSCSTLEDRMRFAAKEVFQRFAFPWASTWSEDLGGPSMLGGMGEIPNTLITAGESLMKLRESLLADPLTLLPEMNPVPKDWGPTKLYNRYDNPNIRDSGMTQLRQAHVTLLETVLDAYARDSSLPNAAALFAKVRDEMKHAVNHGWDFEQPWIDFTVRWVPQKSYRRRIVEALLEANKERWNQEITLIAKKLGQMAESSPALQQKFIKGIDQKGLWSALKNHPIHIHEDDVIAVLDAGVSAGQWVRFDHAAEPSFRWVGNDLTARKLQKKEAEKALKAAASEAKKKTKNETKTKTKKVRKKVKKNTRHYAQIDLLSKRE